MQNTVAPSALEIREDREIELVIGDIDAASQRFTAQAYLPYWVIFMAGQFLNLMGNESLHSQTGGAQPDKPRDIAGAACGYEGLSATAESLPPASAMRIR